MSEEAPALQTTAEYVSPIVLLVSPDSSELENLRAELGDDFYVVADDAMWYRALAYDLLDSVGIRRAEVGRGEAEFMVQQKVEVVSWKEAPYPWFAVLYDGENEPIVVPDIDLPDAVAGMANQ